MWEEAEHLASWGQEEEPGTEFKNGASVIKQCQNTSTIQITLGI